MAVGVGEALAECCRGGGEGGRPAGGVHGGSQGHGLHREALWEGPLTNGGHVHDVKSVVEVFENVVF